MEKDPAFLFFSDKFISGVQTMNWEDRGKYITLLALMHQQGRMDEETIRFIIGSISDKLKSKFKIDEDGLWYNEVLEKETAKRNKFVESRVLNGSKGGRPKNHVLNHTDNHVPNHSVIINKDVNVIINKNEIEDKKENNENGENFDFNDFWNLYDKKVGDKEKLIRKWEKLSKNDRFEIMQYIPFYKKAQPDKKYRKNPETFLNNKSWKDELITSTPEQRKGIDRAAGAMETLIAKKMGGFSSNTSTTD